MPHITPRKNSRLGDVPLSPCRIIEVSDFSVRMEGREKRARGQDSGVSSVLHGCEKLIRISEFRVRLGDRKPESSLL